MTAEVRDAYEGVAHAWAQGPSRVYDVLAEAIVSAYPEPLDGRRVLDLGAGTGAVSRAILRHGGSPTAVDAAEDMVAHMRASGIDSVTGDLLALPFDDGAFDGAVAAFSVSHVGDPVRALREAGRAVRPGGAVVVGNFAAAPANAVKAVVDSVAERFGFFAPPWYLRLKRELEPLTNAPESLAACARRAGLSDVVVSERVIDTGVASPEEIVASRIGMAHLAPWVGGLDASRRSAFIAEATDAVALDPQPLRPLVLIMSSRVRA